MGAVSLDISASLILDAGNPPDPGPIRLGSDAHKNLFCHTLLATFDPYRPVLMEWPCLSVEVQRKITSLPIWDIAVQTEEKAGLRVAAYGEKVRDPLLKRAIELNAHEEKRHKHVLRNMVEAYGISLAPKSDYVTPRDREWAFMVTGYSECIDSFFAFGLFELAKRSGFFPPELVDIFEPIMCEEGRHILFFVNWVAWHRHNMPVWRRPWFVLKILAVWAFLIYERISLGNNLANGQDNNFTVTGAKELGVEVSVRELIELCLAENDRRLGTYDPRLLRPRLVPRAVRLWQRVLHVVSRA